MVTSHWLLVGEIQWLFTSFWIETCQDLCIPDLTWIYRFYLDVDLFPKDPSADVLATQLFPPGPSLKDPCSSRKGEAPLLAGAGPSLKDRGGLALVRPLDGGPSWITIEPRPLLYWTPVCWWKSLEMF